MEYVESPSVVTGPQPRVFLGGGITGCEDWQDVVRRKLENEKKGTLVNPRQAVWPDDHTQTVKDQIAWEFQNLHASNVVSMWFCKASVQPIGMFELGALLTRFRNKDMSLRVLVLGVHPDYVRKFDIGAQVELVMSSVGAHARKRFLQSDNLEDHIKNIGVALKMSSKMNAASVLAEERRTL